MAVSKLSFLAMTLLCIIIVSSQQQQQRRLLNAAKTKFNAFNNGYYQYQYQHSCNCPICNMQSMNINVQNNTASAAIFTDGNNYALTHFCSNDDALFTEAITNAKLTMNDLLNLIQESITNDIDIEVTYHEDIGIPLTITLNTNDIANEETIVIKCIIFDATYPSPVAVDQTRAARGGRNNRNRNTETVSIADFNNDDPYSCSNALDIDINTAPDHNNDERERVGFGRCIEHCPVYYDGCNACQCPHIDSGLSDGINGGKSSDFCSHFEDCLNFIGGEKRTCFRCEIPEMEYVVCGSCDRTCADPQPSCLQSDGCLEKCQCPLHAPIYDKGKCITFEQCLDIQNVDESRKNAKVRDETMLKTALIEDSVQKSNHYIWEDIVAYIIIGVVCVVAGLSLLFWPCLCMKNRIRNSNTREDQLRSDLGPQISYLPDGTALNPVSMVIAMDSGLSGNNSGHLP